MSLLNMNKYNIKPIINQIQQVVYSMLGVFKPSLSTALDTVPMITGKPKGSRINLVQNCFKLSEK